MTIDYKSYRLIFKNISKTSRGVLSEKKTWFITARESDKILAVGECSPLQGLSFDDIPNYETKLAWVCQNIHLDIRILWESLLHFPSIQFGVEQLKLGLKNGHPFTLFPSDFTKGRDNILINGLIWMGDIHYMKSQIEDKLNKGFSCLKLKIGALSFDYECVLLSNIRKRFSSKDLQIRVDANGAFSTDTALEKIQILSDFDIHSIEQPIKAGQPHKMAVLCQKTPIPIALDEELIGVIHLSEKKKLLETIKPQYIILKPSLIGGFRGAEDWIHIAQKQNIGWWATSALESNIGLNAIAQWVAKKPIQLPQGLGTGGLFTNNINSPLILKKDKLYYDKTLESNIFSI